MDIKAQRLEILRQVENGELTLEEASRWLAALDRVNYKNGFHPLVEGDRPVGPLETLALGAAPVIEPASSAVLIAPPPVEKIQPIDPERVEPGHEVENNEEIHPPFWRGWWLIVFIPGLLLLAAAVNWMVQGYLAAGLSWGFWLSFIPFTIGVVMVWLGWEVRIARWFHLHVTQNNKPGPHEITISFPLPVGLVSWGIRRFGRFAGPMRGKNMDSILDEFDQATAKDEPMHIFVDDEDGDKVEIWIDGPRSK